MRAMRAEGFSGYQDLKLVDIPKPAVSDGRVLLRITAAGVTPLDQLTTCIVTTLYLSGSATARQHLTSQPVLPVAPILAAE